MAFETIQSESYTHHAVFQEGLRDARRVFADRGYPYAHFRNEDIKVERDDGRGAIRLTFTKKIDGEDVSAVHMRLL